MSSTQYTERSLVIVSISAVNTVNARMKATVDKAGGDQEFSVPLESVDKPGVVAAYVGLGSWTPSEMSAIQGEFDKIEPGPDDNIRVYSVKGKSPEEEAAFVESTLAELGLQRLTVSDP